MPTFKSYVNDKGYYIHARPSDTGNITYQTTPETDEFLKKLEYTDNDDLPWGLINPLRAAGLIYTEGQGTGAELDDAPELDPSKLTTMSADEAEKLLSYLQSRGDVPDEIHDQLRDIIEGNKNDNTQKLIDALGSQTCPSMTVSEKMETNHDDGVVISIIDRKGESNACYLHEIVIKQNTNDRSDHCIIGWEVSRAPAGYYDVETMTRVPESKLDIMRAMRSLDSSFVQPM
jgi:hypothetical protein